MEALMILIAMIVPCVFAGHGPDLPNPEQYDDEYYDHRESGLLEED